MTILEVMERTGSRDPGVVRALVNDALQEIQRIIPNNSTYLLYDVVAGTRYYDLPVTVERIIDVKRKLDNKNRYITISRVVDVNVDEPTVVLPSSSDSDIVVV